MKSASDGCGYWLAPSHPYATHTHTGEHLHCHLVFPQYQFYCVIEDRRLSQHSYCNISVSMLCIALNVDVDIATVSLQFLEVVPGNYPVKTETESGYRANSLVLTAMCTNHRTMTVRTTTTTLITRRVKWLRRVVRNLAMFQPASVPSHRSPVLATRRPLSMTRHRLFSLALGKGPPSLFLDSVHLLCVSLDTGCVPCSVSTRCS